MNTVETIISLHQFGMWESRNIIRSRFAAFPSPEGAVLFHIVGITAGRRGPVFIRNLTVDGIPICLL